MAAATERRDALVEIRGVTKRFGRLLANDDVSITLPAGRVIGLVGENGAGKSTIMNILAGIYLPDAGAIAVAGRTLPTGRPKASIQAGIGMVHQQFKLVPTLTGLENIRLARRGARALALPERIDRNMSELGFDIDLARPIWQLTLANRQQLEILRTLATGATVLVLDEPTSVLSPPETVRLMGIVRRVAEGGRCVVLISHKLREVFDVADDVIVMRAGRVVHESAVARTDPETLARHIVSDRKMPDRRRPPDAAGERALQVNNLSVDGDHGAPAVRNVSFSVRKGEIVSIAGVTGNGQSELMETLGGLRPPRSGNIARPGAGSSRGYAYIPAQHLGTALAPTLSVADNALLGHHRAPPFGRWMKSRRVRDHARRVIEAYDVSAELDSVVRRLSGGNLQRVVLGRELLNDPDLIVADYPTRGLDIASAAQIRSALVARAAAGAAVLVSSEEIEESLEIANRILVLHGGSIVAERDASGLSAEELGQLMTIGA